MSSNPVCFFSEIVGLSSVSDPLADVRLDPDEDAIFFTTSFLARYVVCFLSN